MALVQDRVERQLPQAQLADLRADGPRALAVGFGERRIERRACRVAEDDEDPLWRTPLLVFVATRTLVTPHGQSALATGGSRAISSITRTRRSRISIATSRMCESAVSLAITSSGSTAATMESPRSSS